MKLRVRPFDDWCPIRPNGTPSTIRPPQTAWLHHGASGRPWSLNTAIGHARYHIRTLGWQTIGYSALVVLDPEPSLLLGRVLQVGAHTRGYNATGAGICVPGNVTSVPDRGVGAVAEALRIGAGEGWWPGQLSGGHRDVGQTACPGSLLYGNVAEINRRAGRSAPDPLPNLMEDEMIIKFSENGKVKVLFDGSGRVRHLSPSANEAVKHLERETDRVVNVGEAPGLSQAGFED